jgi:hypothetical protein
VKYTHRPAGSIAGWRWSLASDVSRVAPAARSSRSTVKSWPNAYGPSRARSEWNRNRPNTRGRSSSAFASSQSRIDVRDPTREAAPSSWRAPAPRSVAARSPLAPVIPLFEALRSSTSDQSRPGRSSGQSGGEGRSASGTALVTRSFVEDAIHRGARAPRSRNVACRASPPDVGMTQTCGRGPWGPSVRRTNATIPPSGESSGSTSIRSPNVSCSSFGSAWRTSIRKRCDWLTGGFRRSTPADQSPPPGAPSAVPNDRIATMANAPSGASSMSVTVRIRSMSVRTIGSACAASGQSTPATARSDGIQRAARARRRGAVRSFMSHIVPDGSARKSPGRRGDGLRRPIPPDSMRAASPSETAKEQPGARPGCVKQAYWRRLVRGRR